MRKQLVRYLLVGGTAYLVEMGVLYGLHEVLHFGDVASVAISFWIGFVVAFILQKFVAFQDYDRRRHVLAKQLVGYSLLVVWNYGFTLAIVSLFSHSVSVFILRTLTILVITLWNFTVYKYLFNSSKS